MSIAGIPKTTIENGQRIEIATGLPYSETSQPTPRIPRYTATTQKDTTLGYTNAEGGYSTAGPKTSEQIQADMMRSAQGEINALRDYENTLLSEQRVINEKNDRSTSSVNTLTGLAGSTEANIQQQKTTAIGQQANKAIQNEVAVKIQSLLGNVRQSAVTEARAQREEARLDEETRLKNRAARQEEAVAQLTNLAAGGVTYEGLKTASPKEFAYLASQFGGEEALRGAFVLNTPQDSILDKKLVGSTYVISKQNPLTGKITVETVDIPGLPPDYSQSVDLGDRIMFYDPADPQGKQFFMSKGMTPSQAMTANGGGEGYNLSSRQQSTLNSIINKYSGDTTIQQGQNVTQLRNIAQMIKSNPDNAGNQLIALYTIVKSLDPESVVREGEIALAQKANSYLGQYGDTLSRISQGRVINPKVASDLADATGRLADEWLSAAKRREQQYRSQANVFQLNQPFDDYIGGFDGVSTIKSGVLRSPDGTQEVDVASLTPEEVQEARNAGWQ